MISASSGLAACLGLLGVEEVGYGVPPEAGLDATAPTDAAPDGSACANGSELCGAECVDLKVNVSHCGACGRTCATCEQGQCQPEVVAFVSGKPEGQPEQTYGVAVDDQNLYFTTIPPCGEATPECNAPGRVLYKDKRRVGDPPSPIAERQSWPEPLVAFGGRVYWGSWSAEDGGVRSAQVALGAPSPPVTHFGCSNCNLYAMAISRASGGPDLFASQYDRAILAIDLRADAGPTDAGGAVVGVENKDGGQPELRRVAVDATRVYWTVTASGVGELRAMARGKVASGTGGPTDVMTLGRLGGTADGIALDDQYVYVASRAGVVVRVPKTGGEPQSLAGGLSGTRTIVVDGDAVYVAGHDAGKVYALVRRGDAWTTITLARGVGAPQDVTFDAEYVYFTGGTDAKVYRVRKPLVK
ncbi:MAG: hypothetical protein JNM74_16690 [Myxococcales bacterium]|nr:hypothetical protein [Myxococcales bacterium]